MEVPGMNPKLSRNRCGNIRWKSMYIVTEAAPGEEACNDTALWCLQTFNCLGPDGKVVDHFECSPSRKCYEQL
jgi:hypothetical protein